MRHRCRLRSKTGWAEFGYFFQPFQACAIDADCAVKLDGQNLVISFVIQNVASRALVFRPLFKGNEDSGNEIVQAGT